MIDMYDSQHFTQDAATATFTTDSDGVTRDDSGEVQIDWDDVETVTIENAPHAEAFDTREFHRLRATVARPIPQPYQFNDELVWLKKPREELKKSAWSLDNRPWTMDHPDTGMVADVDDVRGFWDDTRYYDATDDLDSYLHVPTGDEEAKEYIESNTDVSIGFRNRIVKPDAYDGVVGGADDGDVDIDGYQVSMLHDHCASVSNGRCPAGAGCGIDSGPDHGSMSSVDTITAITNINEDAVTDGFDEQTSVLHEDQSGHEHQGSWYAVPPEDNPDDEWKYPIDNCSDASDAWKLRGHGSLSIDQSTLEARIKQRARDLGCDVPESSEDSLTVDEIDYEITMTDDDCGCNDGGMEISVDDLSPEVAVEKIAEQNDALSEHLSDLRSRAEALDAAADELDVDPSKVADKAGMLDERVEELQTEIDELRRPKMEDAAEFIVEHTDRYGEDADEVIENHDGLDDLESTKELVEELTTQTTDKNANADGGTDGGDEPNVELDRKGYVQFN